MKIRRRAFIAAAGLTVATGLVSTKVVLATSGELPHRVAAEIPWFCSQIALTTKGEMFFGLPRYPDYDRTPCLAKLGSDCKPSPFPGNAWNEWKPGDDGRDT